MSSRPEVDIQTPYTKDVISSKKPLYDPKLTKFFPSIVHGMVSESDDSIIAWLEHGEAFIVGSMVCVHSDDAKLFHKYHLILIFFRPPRLGSFIVYDILHQSTFYN